ncbi:RAC-gamma serine/threonine-protein kinase-like [Lagenorhynchus albirostris]|uniref:RAC-gamma serine/threonine-protein kinase-like n=1 Tax=Lagenorhynchus albirostris TaxID=27610 RepID=UPI0028E31776|nr:RAC-gamma serine/threonine-protein kinase-like [Lagenorhynchus albirostris]
MAPRWMEGAPEPPTRPCPLSTTSLSQKVPDEDQETVPNPFVIRCLQWTTVIQRTIYVDSPEGVENSVWKYGREGFFRLTYVEPEHQSD